MSGYNSLSATSDLKMADRYFGISRYNALQPSGEGPWSYNRLSNFPRFVDGRRCRFRPSAQPYRTESCETSNLRFALLDVSRGLSSRFIFRSQVITVSDPWPSSPYTSFHKLHLTHPFRRTRQRVQLKVICHTQIHRGVGEQGNTNTYHRKRARSLFANPDAERQNKRSLRPTVNQTLAHNSVHE